MSQISVNYQQALLRARSERAWHVAAWRESALTQAAYCAQHGLNATTFNGWLHHKSAQRRAPTDAADATDASVVLPLKAPSRTSASALSTSPLTVIALNAPSSRRASAPLSPSSPPSPSASSPEPSTLIGPGGWRIELGSLANVARLFTMLDQHNVEAANGTNGTNGANGAKSAKSARSANTSKLSSPVRGL